MTITQEGPHKPAKRTVVMAPGVELDEPTSRALSELQDQQEARLVAQMRTNMALRQAIKASRPSVPPTEKSCLKSALDLSNLAALEERPKLPMLGQWQPSTRAATGEFRPLQTILRQEGGLMASNLSDGTHFWGRRTWGGDDLISFSVGGTSHFVLDSENIPVSAYGRYRSAPPGDANGTIYGYQGPYSGPFGSDRRCNCYRVFRQTLFQRINTHWITLGEKFQNEILIRLENSDQHVVQRPLSGFMPSPEFEFGIVDRSQPVWAQVEIRFDVELEGDAAISLGDNPADGVVVRTFGWWARPI